jgi:hypothetical protein
MKDKMNKFGKSMIFLIGIMAVSLFLAPFIRTNGEGFNEGFSGINDLSTPGDFPKSVNQVILDKFPKIGKNKTSDNNYDEIWWKYPVFSLGSFKQITNNLKHNRNPDQGTCIRADFCGAAYNDNKNTKTNIITPLPEAEEGEGARVGYFRSEPNKLYFSIPTNQNILY